ncbi:MAG: ParB/RepB/Spo0J family partition protein [Planctomycetota bacterium]
MTTTLPLAALTDHPDNANAMPAKLFDKLAHHLQREDRYPPLIVRPFADPDRPEITHQLLDGHHRARALRQLGRETARCEVWPCDDDEALLLLATLNRLEGRDDPVRRGQLLQRLTQRSKIKDLVALLPERREHLKRLLELATPAPPPRPPELLPQSPVPITFFLSPADRDRLVARLASLDPSREAALMSLIDTDCQIQNDQGQTRLRPPQCGQH